MNNYLSAVFCDDIRQEMGSKLSLIGVYNGQMYVPEFPVTIPKLCLVTTLVTPAAKVPKSIKFRVLKDSEPLVDLDATPEYLQQLANAREPGAPQPKRTERVNTSQAQVFLTSLVIEKPSVLRVVAVTDAGEVGSVGLQVQLAPDALV